MHPPKRRRQTLPVHPHVCGEHAIQRTCRGGIIGSSPRMWGTYSPGNRDTGNTRFIPTYVGNISEGCSLHLLPSVHPHVCGEHVRHIQKLLYYVQIYCNIFLKVCDKILFFIGFLNAKRFIFVNFYSGRLNFFFYFV